MSSPPEKENVDLPEDHDQEQDLDDYESDEYDIEDDDGEGYQPEDGANAAADDEDDEEDEEDDDDEEEEEGGENLTSLLISGDPVEDENDEGYAPPGETDPADLPVDGNKRPLTPDAEENTSADTNGSSSLNNTVSASGSLKRKTSGDSGDEEEDEEGESETKKLKA